MDLLTQVILSILVTVQLDKGALFHKLLTLRSLKYIDNIFDVLKVYWWQMMIENKSE